MVVHYTMTIDTNKTRVDVDYITIQDTINVPSGIIAETPFVCDYSKVMISNGSTIEPNQLSGSFHSHRPISWCDTGNNHYRWRRRRRRKRNIHDTILYHGRNIRGPGCLKKKDEFATNNRYSKFFFGGRMLSCLAI